MIFKDSKLANLNEIPKTIILLIDNDEKIVESCGKQLELFNISAKNKKLNKLFSKNNYNLLREK